MSDLENGWLLEGDFEIQRDEDDVICYCECCEKPIYYNQEYHYDENGEKICCECYDEYLHKQMEEEMEKD